MHEKDNDLTNQNKLNQWNQCKRIYYIFIYLFILSLSTATANISCGSGICLGQLSVSINKEVSIIYIYY